MRYFVSRTKLEHFFWIRSCFQRATSQHTGNSIEHRLVTVAPYIERITQLLYSCFQCRYSRICDHMQCICLSLKSFDNWTDTIPIYFAQRGHSFILDMPLTMYVVRIPVDWQGMENWRIDIWLIENQLTVILLAHKRTCACDVNIHLQLAYLMRLSNKNELQRNTELHFDNIKSMRNKTFPIFVISNKYLFTRLYMDILRERICAPMWAHTAHTRPTIYILYITLVNKNWLIGLRLILSYLHGNINA